MADLELIQQTDDDLKLWAVHVEGPDDVIAAIDRTEGDERAKEINTVAAALAARRDASPNDPKFRAVVVKWPYSPEEHAEELQRDDRWEL